MGTIAIPSSQITHTHENENVLSGRCDRKKNLVWIKERNRYQITGFLVGSVCFVLPMSKTNPCMPQSKAEKIPSEWQTSKSANAKTENPFNAKLDKTKWHNHANPVCGILRDMEKKHSSRRADDFLKAVNANFSGAHSHTHTQMLVACKWDLNDATVFVLVQFEQFAHSLFVYCWWSWTISFPSKC